jgi:hypothetical protein
MSEQLNDAAADEVAAKYQLDAAKKRLADCEREYRKTGSVEDARDWQAALADHAQASHALKEGMFAAKLQAGNAKAAADQAAREQAERDRVKPVPTHIPGRVAPAWTNAQMPGKTKTPGKV